MNVARDHNVAKTRNKGNICGSDSSYQIRTVQSVKTEPVMFRQNELQLCCLAAIVEVFRLIFSYSAAHLQ